MLSSEGSDMESDKSLNIAFVESFGFAESLDIIGCNFTNLKDVSALTNLKRLRITRPKNLTDFPNLVENKNLKELDISDPNLTDLKGIGQCTNLKTISLSSNKNLRILEYPLVLNYHHKLGSSKMRVFKNIYLTLKLVIFKKF